MGDGITAEQVRILCHSLGLPRWVGVRNHYVSTVDSEVDRMCVDLVDRGLMRHGKRLDALSARLFHVTDEGRRVAVDSCLEGES